MNINNSSQGERDETKREDRTFVRGDIPIDGYTGPRARMVFDKGGLQTDRIISSDTDGTELGFFERLTSVLLALFTVVGMTISIILLPVAGIIYVLYGMIERAVRLMLPKKHNQRFVLLGEEGSYIVKDAQEREFVAKGIPTKRSAEKILRIFEQASSRGR